MTLDRLLNVIKYNVIMWWTDGGELCWSWIDLSEDVIIGCIANTKRNKPVIIMTFWRNNYVFIALCVCWVVVWFDVKWDDAWREAVFSLNVWPVLAPVPLTVFRSNSKLGQDLECFGLNYAQPITTTFCIRHGSYTVVTWAKFRCDRPNMLWTRALQSFINFGIRSKYH